MKRVLRVLLNIDFIVAILAFSSIVCITLAGVFMRKVIGQPIAWLEEVQILLFVWTIFFGASIAFRTGSQVGIDIVADLLKGKARIALDIFVYIVTIAIVIYMFNGSIGLIQGVTKKVTPFLRISYTVIDAAAPIGCAFMIIQYTAIMIQKLFVKNNREDAKE